jgi:hypothetical protein
MPIIRVNKRENPYGPIVRSPIEEDPTISFKAKGMLTYLLLKPDGWTIQVGDLVKRATDGESSVRSGLHELEEAGYLICVQGTDDQGRFAGYSYEVFEYKLPEDQRTNPDDRKHSRRGAPPSKKQPALPFGDFPKTDIPNMGKPDAESPDAENQDVSKTSSLSKTTDERKETPTATPSKRQLKHVSSKHPAVVIYKATGISRPQPAARDAIGETVGEDDDRALTIWGRVVRWWTTTGNKNPKNVHDMLQIFTEASTYPDEDGDAAFESWLEVRNREGWGRPYRPPTPVPTAADLPAARPQEVTPEERNWQETLSILELEMPRATFDAWLRDTTCLGPNGDPDTLRVAAKNEYAVDWLSGRLYGRIEKTLARIAGRTLKIEFVVKQQQGERE